MARAAGDNLRLRDVKQARERIAHIVRRTPVLCSPSLDASLGCSLLLKAENLQRTGSFKIRGAANMIACLTREARRRGV
ncbi:MAG: pyridoxal-phosphate dependent enzyme, partial [SAR202 cluster bacterium]|nr:pyridoxal-phosphate dependent enzyme [SAR202 cluster bacterium]